jgi:hypothetical protein
VDKAEQLTICVTGSAVGSRPSAAAAVTPSASQLAVFFSDVLSFFPPSGIELFSVLKSMLVFSAV